MKKRVKVAVTGAAGQIGYALLFRIASGQMFGPETEVELQLLELERALPALEGVAMELDDCAFPLLKKITCTADLKTAFDGAHWSLLVGSVPRKAGMERGDLLQINGGIFKAQGEAINKYADASARVLVVGNPCNTNCLIAMNHAPDVPKDRFFAMTMLDENRARTQIAKKAQVDITAIKNLTIWGNHSATQYPDFYHATVAGKPLNTSLDEKWLQGEFLTLVQQRGAEIIKARGASSAASAANAAVDTVWNLTHDTPAGDSFSVALCSTGEYQVEPGLIFSYPCRVENQELKILEGIEHQGFGAEKFHTTHQELVAERDAVRSLGLI